MRPAAPLIASLAGAIVLPCCWAENGGGACSPLWTPKVDTTPKSTICKTAIIKEYHYRNFLKLADNRQQTNLVT